MFDELVVWDVLHDKIREIVDEPRGDVGQLVERAADDSEQILLGRVDALDWQVRASAGQAALEAEVRDPRRELIVQTGEVEIARRLAGAPPAGASLVRLGEPKIRNALLRRLRLPLRPAPACRRFADRNENHVNVR
jgi:hypothetical protein